jgi:hypothetical protein
MAGKPIEITLSIARHGGFDAAIKCNVIGLPDSVSVSQSAPQGDSAQTVKLRLSTTGGAFSGAIRISAEAAGTSQLVRLVTAAMSGQNARTNDLWLTVVPASP